MTCRVFLVGEGPTDIGDLAHPPSYRDHDDPREGFLQPITRKLVGTTIELEFFDGRRLVGLAADTKRQPHHWMQRRKAAQALSLATYLGADALIFACDVDKAHGAASKTERRKRLRDIRQSILEGFDHVRQSDPEAANVLTAIAVPARMIEAWALGDRQALARLLRLKTSTLSYGRPEELWGAEDDPKSAHPKSVWRRMTDGAVGFSQIGDAADPDALRSSCPDSFGAFADDVELAVERCPAIDA